MSFWNHFEPTADAPWNLRRVVHLHRRAVFGVCWAEVQRDLNAGPQAAVSRLLDGTCRSAGTPDDFDGLATTIGNSAVASGSAERLKAWWLYRCLFSPRPLEERMTLMWHNHFATSNLKVNNLRLMKQQNETLRQHAFSPFGDLLHAMSHDPALLEWLDAPSNRAGMPNENLARELMELFSLGIGNYSERDVKEAARALTGWTVRQGNFRAMQEVHDGDSKTILNQSGNWSGDDFVRILLEQNSCARRIAWRLTNEFCGENAVTDAALDELAGGLRKNHLDVRWGVETILRSALFFSDENIQSRVADPVSFLLIPLRALECWRSPPSTLLLAEWLGRIGQDLFNPPNVGGWTGGRGWLSTRTVIARANYATAITAGQLANPERRLDMPAGMADIPDPVERLRRLGDLLCGGMSAETVRAIIEKSGLQSKPDDLPWHCISEFLTRPETQLH
ncbi:MAG: DUF1800 domain-containing protein [Planctomycetia bacterium]|nr:DUF1800 domain-containing protein [Planctomycetia bacterium]